MIDERMTLYESIEMRVHELIRRRKCREDLIFITYTLIEHNNFKPAFIVDGNLGHYVDKGHEIKALIECLDVKDIKLIRIGEDLILCSLKGLKRLIYSDFKPLLIDVSKNAEKPTIVEDSSILNTLIETLSAFLTSFNKDEVFKELPIPENTNLTSLFGLMLNYPTIYHFKDEVWMHGLTLKKCQISLNFKGEEKILASFTFPEKLNVEDHVEEWYNVTYSNAGKDLVKRHVSTEDLNSFII